ncbi:MAG: enoyl-CoA hydratase-related protein [Candidatus Limnocylindria bacterium]|nr:enoyl-CoA hydratase-related protein [Candidatus Limnocylindria bacterium]
MPDLVLVAREEPIAVVQLNRPEVLNALNAEVLDALASRLEELDRDEAIRCIVLSGNDKAFAAGADIKGQFVDATAISMLKGDLTAQWQRVARIKKPLVAAVSGFALGGGCELAMACDLIVCSETAQFGQPEVNLGVIPGGGGTQRLTRAVGKYVANDLILTGRFVKADEALRIGLVSRVFPAATWLDDAKAVARTIAAKAPIAIQLAKELVNAAQSLPLEAGLLYERKSFALLFASADVREGVDAFVGKRKAVFTGE